MGIFKKKVPYDPSALTVKDIMKMRGEEPNSQWREFFGWTEKDDAESQEVALSKKKRQLSEMKTSGATLRKIMELEISIKSTENWLKENKSA